MADVPGDTPVRLNLEDGGIFSVVELDFWVPQLCSVDVHHDWGGAWDLPSWRHTHNLFALPPGQEERRKDKLFEVKCQLIVPKTRTVTETNSGEKNFIS